MFKAQHPAPLRPFTEYFRYEQPQLSAQARKHSPAVADPLIATSGAIQIELCEVADETKSWQKRPITAQFITQTGQVTLWKNVEAFTQAEQFWLSTTHTEFLITPRDQQIRARLQAAAWETPHTLTNTYALFALLLALRQQGVYHLHAAALRTDAQQTVWLCGAQRAGKTTLTTALSLAGWQPLADDSLLLRAATSEWQALRKQFHLSDELLANWPQLASYITAQRGDGRCLFAALEYFGTAAAAGLPQQSVNTILFPQITNAATSRLELCAPHKALQILLQESIYFPLWPHHTAQQWAMLAALVKQANCFTLHAGRDVIAQPTAFARWLANTIAHSESRA